MIFVMNSYIILLNVTLHIIIILIFQRNTFYDITNSFEIFIEMIKNTFETVYINSV